MASFRDWPCEDYYFNRCVYCNNGFMGNKDRYVCFPCDEENRTIIITNELKFRKHNHQLSKENIH